jgi:plasmid stability protein
MVSIVVPGEFPMATITLKNIPDDLYDRLKVTAKAHHRSINSELIYCLETVLKPSTVSADQRLARIRSVRPKISQTAVELEDIRDAINKGRP